MPILGCLAWDPPAARVLSAGAARPRRFDSSALRSTDGLITRVLEQITRRRSRLAQALGDPALLSCAEPGVADESLSGLPLFGSDPTLPVRQSSAAHGSPDASTSLAAATVDGRVTAGAPGACRRSPWTGTWCGRCASKRRSG